MPGTLVLLGACPHLCQEDRVVITRRGADEGELARRIVALDVGDLEELGDQCVAFAGARFQASVLSEASDRAAKLPVSTLRSRFGRGAVASRKGSGRESVRWLEDG
jgi:hypothetical protein